MKENKISSQRILQNKVSILFDVIILIIFNILVYIVSSFYSLHEYLHNYFDKLKFIQVNKIILILLSLFFSIIIFAIRRIIEQRKEILARINSQKQMFELNQQMEFILGATKTGLDIIDSNFNMIYVNPEWAEIYGKHKGKKCYEYFMGKDGVCPGCGIVEASQTKKPVVKEEILAKENNRPILVTTIPFQNDRGEWLFAEINVDITEKNRMQEELKAAKERAELIYRVIPSAVFTVDKQRRITSWNNKAAEITGYSAQEVMGKECLMFAEHPCKDKCGLYAQDVAKPVIAKECVIRRIDGQARIISKNVDLLKDTEGNIIGGIESFENITERKKIENELKESGNKARAIFDQSFEFIGLINTAGVLIESNRAALEFAGIEASTVIGKPFWETPWWTHSAQLQKKLREAIKKTAAGEFVRFEATHTAKDGSLHYVDFSLKPVKDATGKVIFLIPEGRDITERKKAEEELRLYKDNLEEIVKEKAEKLVGSEARYRRLFESAKDGILIVNAYTGKIEDVNPFLTKMLGYSKEEFLGKKLWEIGLFKDIAANKDAFVQLQAKEYIRYEDLPLLTKDGIRKEVEFVSNVYLMDHTKVVQCNIRDITERKIAERKIQDSEAKFKVLFNNSRDGILLVEVETKLFFIANNALCNMLGYGIDEIRSIGIKDIHTPDDLPKVLEVFDMLARGEIEFAADIPVKRKDNTVFYCDINVSKITLDNRMYLMGSFRDVTERRQKDILLKEERDRSQLYLDISGVLTLTLNIKGEIELINEAGCKILGYKKEELIGRNWFENFIPEKQSTKVMNIFRKLISGESKITEYYENSVLLRDQSERIISWHNVLIKDDQGKIQGILSSGLDITEQKNTELELRDRLDKIGLFQRTILELEKIEFSDLNFAFEKITKTCAHVLKVERASLWLFNQDSSELICEKMYKLGSDSFEQGMKLVAKQYPRYFSAVELSRVIATNDVNNNNNNVSELIDDYLKPLGITSMLDVPIRMRGKIYGIVCNEHIGEKRSWSIEEQDFASSIADLVSLVIENLKRREAEEQLLKSKEELERMNIELKSIDQLKSDFVSNVSHELRTPLTIIMEAVSLFLQKIPGGINKKQEEILEMVGKNTQRLSRTINNLLDISKIESKSVEIAKELVDLNKLISQLVSTFGFRAKQEGLELLVDCPVEKVDVYGDSDKITEVFTNLIGNSLKYTQKGFIKISFKINDKEIECSVTDTGIGIENSELDKVFNKFYQFGKLGVQKYKGTGLGLAICKGIIELHGGRIWVESPVADKQSKKFGKGAKFSFTLPKYFPQSKYQEYLNKKIKEANDKRSRLSIIIISLAEFEELKKQIPDEKIFDLLKELKEVLSNSLRRSGDVALKDSGEIAVILMDCDKKSLSSVKERLQNSVMDYLNKKKIADKLKLNFGYATFPDDAGTEQDLIKRAESSFKRDKNE